MPRSQSHNDGRWGREDNRGGFKANNFRRDERWPVWLINIFRMHHQIILQPPLDSYQIIEYLIRWTRHKLPWVIFKSNIPIAQARRPAGWGLSQETMQILDGEGKVRKRSKLLWVFVEILQELFFSDAKQRIRACTLIQAAADEPQSLLLSCYWIEMRCITYTAQKTIIKRARLLTCQKSSKLDQWPSISPLLTMWTIVTTWPLVTAWPPKVKYTVTWTMNYVFPTVLS